MARNQITFNIPGSLKLTAVEKKALGRTFQAHVVGVLKDQRPAPDGDITNVDNPVAMVMAEMPDASGSTKSSKKTGKKASKK